jgi:8-oxo-dGTP diphosphatase
MPQFNCGMNFYFTMAQSDQGIVKDRYMLIPRWAIFVRRGDEYLLIKGALTKRLWAGKYNGLGGHVERGEDVLSSAKRELLEESGITADLWLCGTVAVDSGDVGICLFVFCGENAQGEIKASAEGAVEWVKKEALAHLAVVEDLPVLLNRIHEMKRGDAPFSARSFYKDDTLNVIFEK